MTNIATASDQLTAVRQQIDAVDSQVVELLARRMELVREIHKIKRSTGMEPHQAARYEAMLQKLEEEAAGVGLDAQLVRDVWAVIHAHSVAQQESWRKNA